MRHKHYDCIVAWAEGKTIEVLQVGSGRWLVNDEPQWQTHVQYRVQPAPPPDVVQTCEVSIGFASFASDHPTVQFTFDGKTKKLKSAEVL